MNGIVKFNLFFNRTRYFPANSLYVIQQSKHYHALCCMLKPQAICRYNANMASNTIISTKHEKNVAHFSACICVSGSIKNCANYSNNWYSPTFFLAKRSLHFIGNDNKHNINIDFNKLRRISKYIKLVLGFVVGITIGGAFKLSYNMGVLSRQFPIQDDLLFLHGEESKAQCIPSVKAAEGFNNVPNPDEQISDDERNNNVEDKNIINSKYKSFFGFSGKDSGKDPPRHRDKFNFIADVVERLAPSVVYIEIMDMHRRDFNGQPLAINNGSGFVVDSSGLIITNAHVVMNRPRSSRVLVRLHDGKELVATLQEVDVHSDLALLKVNASGLPPAPLGNSSTLRPGEFVVAVGSPLSLSNTVTAGVVSSTARCARDLGIQKNDINYIQTDAAITFGNSGGPLANLDGEVIGINSMKAAFGISFAIPVDVAKSFLAEAAKRRQATQRSPAPDATPSRRRYLGITMLSLTPDVISELQTRLSAPLPPDVRHGVLVWRVVVGSPAYHAGLQPGDVVTQINGHDIATATDVYRLLEKPSDLTMVVHRGGNRYTVTVTPEE